MEHSSEASLPEMIAEVTVLLVSCCGTVLANIMVLINVTIKEKLHAPTYYYYLSLAVSDLILGKNHSWYISYGKNTFYVSQRWDAAIFIASISYPPLGHLARELHEAQRKGKRISRYKRLEKWEARMHVCMTQRWDRLPTHHRGPVVRSFVSCRRQRVSVVL